MHTVCLFNNKGGVGKTTLLCNVAAQIANDFELSVLLVDADPQCNATQLVLPEKRVEALYSTRPKDKSILDVLRPIGRGEPSISTQVEVIPASESRFGFDLLPGHPGLALLEDKFSSAWLGFEGGDFAGLRQSNWVSQFRASLADRYDIVLFDLGPSLGALNRTVLLGADFFATPLSCDIFSIAGLQNISAWFKQWMSRYSAGLETCRSKWGAEIDDYPHRSSTDDVARFIGYTVQQYITKVRHGERRPTIAYERIRSRIPKAIESTVSTYKKHALPKSRLDLGDVPNMFSLVPLAQSVNVPVFSLEGSDGLNGAQYAQRDNYAKFLEKLAHAFLRNLDYQITSGAE